MLIAAATPRTLRCQRMRAACRALLRAHIKFCHTCVYDRNICLERVWRATMRLLPQRCLLDHIAAAMPTLLLLPRYDMPRYA